MASEAILFYVIANGCDEGKEQGQGARAESKGIGLR
jgi:hypothetical protein